MATLRHQGPLRASVPAPAVHSETTDEGHPILRAVDFFDRPLRYAAGEDLALLRILRGAALATSLAAIAAVVAGLF